jgi:uncharacterized protein YceH (UPF0502 family)
MRYIKFHKDGHADRQAGRRKDRYKQILQGAVKKGIHSLETVMKRSVRRAGEEKIKPYSTWSDMQC